jgi:hypothetical protein
MCGQVLASKARYQICIELDCEKTKTSPRMAERFWSFAAFRHDAKPNDGEQNAPRRLWAELLTFK